MSRKMEISVGFFVLVAFILLGVMIVGFSNSKYIGDKYVVNAIFNYVSGVVQGAPVRYAGVDVGSVLEIVLFEDPQGFTKVRLQLGIQEGVGIKKDSMALVNSLGIIGEKYIEILPGTPEAGILNPNDEVQGVDPVALEMVMSKANDALGHLKSSLKAINNILSEETQENVKTTIRNFKDAGANVDRLAKKIELVVDKINKGDGTVGKLIYAQELHDELLALIKGLREHGLFYKDKSGQKTKTIEKKARKNFSGKRNK